jgi:hypothetical protein
MKYKMKFLKNKMEVKMKKLNCLLIFMAFSLLLSAQEIPLKISYQGKLFDSGIPVNDTKKIKFMIGSSWEETHENVEIVGGLYSVTLGSINPIPYTLFDDNPSLQLEIKVGETTLSPNTDILSSPYAFKAEKAVDTEKLNGQEPSYYQNWYNLNNIPSDIADGDDVDDADNEPANEIQNLDFNMDTYYLSITEGNSIWLPIFKLPFQQNYSGDDYAFNIEHFGSDGEICQFKKTNNNNNEEIIDAITEGSGSVARFRINNSSNSFAALYVETNGTGAAGIFRQTNTSSNAHAVWGRTWGSGYAGYFEGDVYITGELIGGKSSSSQTYMAIDHPTEQEKKVLTHAALYSPEMTTVYKGRVCLQNGQAIIKLPSYFEALNHPENREINLTCVNGWSPLYLEGEIANNQFIVKTTEQGNQEQEFSWVVYAVRNDKWAQDHPMVVEEEKGVKNRFEKGELIYDKYNNELE